MEQLAFGEVFAVREAYDPFDTGLVTDTISSAPESDGGIVTAGTMGKTGVATTTF
jgi:hypothetical protein